MELVLVGLDGSKAAEDALRWAGRVVGHTGGRLLAVHAQRHPHAEIPPAEAERILAERQATLSDQWVRAAVGSGVEVETKVVAGDPRTSLLTAAEDEGADLVVVGRSGAGGEPGFLHLGSVAEHAAHHTRIPFAVVPAGGGGPIRRIELGVDGSEPSAAAVRWCVELATATGAPVTAVNVAEPLLEWTPSTDESNWRRFTEHEIEAWTQPLRDHGVEVETVASEHLRPADGLLEEASSRQADLLVVGTRGAGGFTGLRFGGVALKVLHQGSLPIVLVPPGES